MNDKRRKKLYKVLDALDNISENSLDKQDVIDNLTYARDMTEDCKDDEDYALSNKPESLMWSAGYQDMEDNVSDLETAVDSLESIINECEDNDAPTYPGMSLDIDEVIKLINEVIER